MPDRLSSLTREVASATSATGILHVLQDYIDGSMHVLSVRLDIEHPHNILYDDSVPHTFRRDYNHIVNKRHGQSATIRYALSNPPPYTFLEAKHILKPSGQDLWLFELADLYGMHDGFVSTHGHSVIVFWSEQKLILQRETRYALHQIGTAVIDRLNELMAKKTRSIDLAPRELEALEHYARGAAIREVAKQMNISYATAHTYLTRVRQKLKARNFTHAAVIAVKKKWIL